MSEKENTHRIRWLEKIKNIKHIEIYIAIIFVVIILLIFFSNRTQNKKTEVNTNEMTVSAYINSMENELEEILSNIAGVSNVNVMISLNLNDLEVIDNNINLKKFPAVNGVLITAKGVNVTATRLKVLHAIEAVIDVKNGNIEILSSE